jgi:hypothetical protein
VTTVDDDNERSGVFRKALVTLRVDTGTSGYKGWSVEGGKSAHFPGK